LDAPLNVGSEAIEEALPVQGTGKATLAGTPPVARDPEPAQGNARAAMVMVVTIICRGAVPRTIGGEAVERFAQGL
jgi:hypothetical protein